MRKYMEWMAAALLLGTLAGCAAPQQAQTVPQEQTTATGQTTETTETTPPTETDALPAPPQDTQSFVRVQDYIPDIAVDLRYATKNNFTGTVIYAYDDAWLRYDTVSKLAEAQEQLKAEGYRLCIWDAFRSAQSQQKLWEVYPDGNYVANPANGYSGHTRGDTVDVTLVTLAGEMVEMPSGFDDFTALADRNYEDVSAAAGERALLLERVMESCGFSGYDKEWWHYSDNDRAQPAPDFEPTD